MKAKKTAPSRRRVSFAVDRDEIEINSDWVDAVMNPVATPAVRRDPSPSAVITFPSLPDISDQSLSTVSAPPSADSEPAEPVFFAPDTNSATGAETATGERCTPVENSAAVDNLAPVAQSTPVADESSVERGATVAELATVERLATVESLESGRNSPVGARSSVAENATVEHTATDEEYSTGALSTSTKDHRIPRPRPILRVTDGLTPGQYAVYSLMYEAGQGTADASRIYKGGYADLCRLTGLSKRGIQNIVAELQAKQVIRIHQQPGYHRTETSAYLVPDPEAVLHIWFANGRRHALGKSKLLVP